MLFRSYGKIKLRKIVDAVTITTSKSYVFKFGNKIYHPHDGHSLPVVTSNTIPHRDINGTVYFDTFLEDDGRGVINVVRMNTDTQQTDGMSGMVDQENHIVIYPSVGVVDYSAGTVTLNSNFVPYTENNEGIAFPVAIKIGRAHV